MNTWLSCSNCRHPGVHGVAIPIGMEPPAQCLDQCRQCRLEAGLPIDPVLHG